MGNDYSHYATPAARKQFTRVLVRKPDASRQESREVYWVASGHRASAPPE
ncbi:MAG: SAM-dependent methyltransferase [Porticoccaceae bacterium]